MKKIRNLLTLNGILFFISTFNANALEYWQFLETRIKIAKDKVDLLPETFRFISSVRLDERYPGLGTANFRMGPLFKITDNFLLGFSTSVYGEQIRPQVFGQQFRLELEPNFNFNFNPFSINNRVRLEYRFLNYDTFSNSMRLRNQLRFNYKVNDAFLLYAWDDVFFEVLNNPRFNQNRFSLGVGLWFDKASRVDIGYILRNYLSSTTNNWETYHIISLNIVFSPENSPILATE